MLSDWLLKQLCCTVCSYLMSTVSRCPAQRFWVIITACVAEMCTKTSFMKKQGYVNTDAHGSPFPAWISGSWVTAHIYLYVFKLFTIQQTLHTPSPNILDYFQPCTYKSQCEKLHWAHFVTQYFTCFHHAERHLYGFFILAAPGTLKPSEQLTHMPAATLLQ
jgi:hypothetical protein